MDQDAVLRALRAHTTKGNLEPWAKANGFSRAFVYRVLNGINPPSERMCEALGFRKTVVTTYEVAK